MLVHLQAYEGTNGVCGFDGPTTVIPNRITCKTCLRMIYESENIITLDSSSYSIIDD